MDGERERDECMYLCVCAFMDNHVHLSVFLEKERKHPRNHMLIQQRWRYPIHAYLNNGFVFGVISGYSISKVSVFAPSSSSPFVTR